MFGPSAATAQTLTIAHRVIVNGSSTPASGGAFTILATIGQVVGTDTSGGSFTLIDALWAAPTTPTPFTDHVLTPGASPIRALHITELRTRIDALRARWGLSAFPYRDAPLVAGVTSLSAAHIADLREALVQAYVSAGRTPPTYADPAISAGTLVRAVHVIELRLAVIALESVGS